MHPPRILAVDDAPDVLNLVVKILAAQGYDVLSAADGTAAIAAFERAGGIIDLLLTDVIMPGISGMELAEKVIASSPAIPVLFISGQCEETVLRERVSKDGFRFLAKPFLPQALVDAVNEALARRGLPRKGSAPYTDCSGKTA